MTEIENVGQNKLGNNKTGFNVLGGHMAIFINVSRDHLKTGRDSLFTKIKQRFND